MRILLLFLITSPILAQDVPLNNPVNLRRMQVQPLQLPTFPEDAQKLAAYLGGNQDSYSDAALLKLDQHIKKVVQRSNNWDKLSIANNYAVFLLRRDKHTLALNLLKDLYQAINLEAELNASEAARCMYHFGRLWEAEDDSGKAINWYTKAARLDAAYRAPVRRLLAAARESGDTETWRRLVDLVGHHARNNRQAMAARLLGEFLALGPEDLQQIFAVDFAGNLRHYLLEAAVTPAIYKKRWQQPLESAWTSLDKPLVKWDPLHRIETKGVAGTVVRTWMKVLVLHTMYSGSFDGTVRHAEVQKRHLRKAGFSSAKLGEFARMVGSDFMAIQAYPQARNLLLLAWSLNPRDTQSGVMLSRVLLLGGKAVDPDGDVLDYLLKVSFEAKGSAYQSNDYPLIYQYHVMLATIFQEQGVIDSPRPFWGARKQWQLAANIHERMAREAKDAWRPSPRLYESLAQVNLAGQRTRPEKAFEAYTTATQQYVMLDRKAEGRRMYTKRATLGIARPSRSETRLAQSLFLPKDGNKQVARMMADQVAYSASGGKIGKKGNFAKMDLRNYDFSGMNLKGVDFKDANLSGATFREVDLSGANLSGAKTEGATLDRVIRTPQTKLPPTLTVKQLPANLQTPAQTIPNFDKLKLKEGETFKLDQTTIKKLQTVQQKQ